jgi:hypothetical protein
MQAKYFISREKASLDLIEEAISIVHSLLSVSWNLVLIQFLDSFWTLCT